MKVYKIRRKSTGGYSLGHGDVVCNHDEGKIYSSARSAKQALTYSINQEKRIARNFIKWNDHKTNLSLQEQDRLKEAKKFIYLLEKEKLRPDFEIVEYELVEQKTIHV